MIRRSIVQIRPPADGQPAGVGHVRHGCAAAVATRMTDQPAPAGTLFGEETQKGRMVMTQIRTLLGKWRERGAPADDEMAEFSIVAQSGAVDGLDAALRAAFGDVAFTLRPAFSGVVGEETGHRFFILTFPDLAVRGNEAIAFETARALTELEEVASARPVLIDSLVGEAMVAREIATESIFSFCSTDDPGPAEHGWGPYSLGVLAAWKKTRGDGVTVASIDTGYSAHDELADVITTTKPHLNLVEGGADARDRFSTSGLMSNPGHGTLVASVVASRGTINPDATTNGPNSVTGAAPDAKILPIRAIRSVIDIRQSRIPAAIEHAIATDCDVIIMALGSPFPIESVEVALRAAVRRGMVVVCAAGNCVGAVIFPARFAPQGLTTAVAAVDYQYMPWEKTSSGDTVTVSAFGEAVWGARKSRANGANNFVEPAQGTTLASSLTAGVAALWIAANGGRAALKAKADAAGVTVQKLFNDALVATAYRPAGWARGMGAGLVNAGAMVSHAIPAGLELVADVPLAVDHVTPLRRFLSPTIGETESIAGLEAATMPEELAAEVLWRFHHANARRRFTATAPHQESLALEAVPPPSRETPALLARLAEKPFLRALLR